MWQKCPLPCFRAVNTGATLFLPYTSCYGANCLQEWYDQCLNTANVAPWVYHSVIIQSGSPILSPQKWARTRGGVSITEPVKEGSTVAISAEGDPQYHFYKVTGKQNTSELITDDYGTEFPQTLISYKAILSQRKFYRHDLQSWQENVCSGCPVDMLHIWNMKWMEQRKAEQRGPKLLKLTTEQEKSLRTSWANCR